MTTIMEKNDLDRELIGVLFPGVVKNDEKALACLGGIRNISHVYSQINKKRLGLSYQPDNPFVRKIFATSKRTAGVLLKVKVKKTKVDNKIQREVVATSVVGCVKTMFKFESMCDFQYLPVQRQGSAEGPLNCILEHILPSGLDTYSVMMEPVPLCLIPPSFTRFEKPIRYTYTEKRYLTDRSSPEQSVGESVHNKIRSLRASHVAPYIFSLNSDMPTKPNDSSLSLKAFKEELNPTIGQEYEAVKKLFEERPVWSLNLIKFRTKVRGASLKVIMPCVAVYHKTGPWRSMWVRFGYDPRKDPEARIYQTLDFRLRHGQGIRTLIMSRDEPSASPSTSRKVGTEHYNEIPESCVYFRPDTVPTQRHIFYQFCDVKIPEVQDILAVAPPPGYLCHVKRGWLPAATDEHARDHMFKYMKNTLLSSTNADLSKLEQGDGSGSEDDSNSDDDGRTSEMDQTEDQIDEA
ncbi:general transcription factor IIIC subunit l(2)37Cd [Anticarsia gemmatalis]|uniref:general transcription factor IIIC subunit l(2)37Cd n=1 Tax=Anticarsia gemmatalis TaxID=129554 RepID=UPI003F758B40